MDGQPGCTYYMTLLQSGGQQIHIGDFVYVAPADLLLPSADNWVKHIDQLGIYCVERLWTDARLMLRLVCNSAGWANSRTGQKLYICLSVCLSVC